MSNSKRCAACKHLRRRCSEDCLLAPYFPSTHPKRFEFVHKIFGASNVTRMLQQLPEHERLQAANSICYEAYYRVRDPVYGAVKIISDLQQEINVTQCELTMTQAQIHTQATHEPPPLPWFSGSNVHQQQEEGEEEPAVTLDHGLLDHYICSQQGRGQKLY